MIILLIVIDFSYFYIPSTYNKIFCRLSFAFSYCPSLVVRMDIQNSNHINSK